MTNRVGQQLGNYRLVRFLGAGGFAEVYLGEHMLLGTPAAIKILDARLQQQEAQKFREEARTIARLIHPHIIRLLEFGIEGNTPFMVMDYAPNGTLKDRHPKGSQLPLSTIVSYVKQIADGLQFAHDEKYIHRDIKPENMLVGRRNEILLSDFGIAVIAHSTLSRKTEDLIGTPSYMAPEQIQKHPTPASDQYALGVIVYQWISGSLPFEGTGHEVAIKHLTVPPPPLHTKVPAISPTVEQVVLKALAKDPRQRFPSVQEFATALEQASQPQQPALAPASPQGTIPDHLSNTLLVPLPPRRKPGTTYHTYQGHHLVWSPDGQHVAFISDKGKGIQVWEVWANKQIYTYEKHSEAVLTLAWSPDGRYIASGGRDNIIHIWEALSGKPILYYEGGRYFLKFLVVWSPDGQYIASSDISPTDYGTTIRVWNAKNGKDVNIYQSPPNRFALAWSPDGQYICSPNHEGVCIWQATTGKEKVSWQTKAQYALAWSSDGQYIIGTTGGENGLVQIWNASNGENTIDIYVRASSYSVYPCSLAWSPNGQYIAIGCNGEVQIRELQTKKLMLKYPQGGYLHHVSWSPDGEYIASSDPISGSVESTVQIWQAV